VRDAVPGCSLEVLVPDFRGSGDALRAVFDARPDVFNHNVETVPRLYPAVRPQARYARSLDVLARAVAAGLTVKTGLMAGLGESSEEVVAVMRDLRAVGVHMFTIGQYLQPSRAHHPVARYVPPGEFDDWKRIGLDAGFARVEAGPLVRSSYHAESLLGDA
jgi:lipoic acid synthetase